MIGLLCVAGYIAVNFLAIALVTARHEHVVPFSRAWWQGGAHCTGWTTKGN